jgi:hypothetical protein
MCCHVFFTFYQHFGEMYCLQLSGSLYVTLRLDIRENLYFLYNFLLFLGEIAFFCVCVSGNYIGVLQIKIKFAHHFFVLIYYTRFLQIPFSVLKDYTCRHNLMYVHLQFMQLTHNISKSDFLQARWLVLIPEAGMLLVTQLAVKLGLCQKQTCQNVKYTIHIHLLLRLRMYGILFLLPSTFSNVCYVTTRTSYYCFCFSLLLLLGTLSFMRIYRCLLFQYKKKVFF